ncbi:hypothetical protein PAPH110629_02510 [Paenibacillus phoenicis]
MSNQMKFGIGLKSRRLFSFAIEAPFDRRRSIIPSQARTSRWLLALFYLLYIAFPRYRFFVVSVCPRSINDK